MTTDQIFASLLWELSLEIPPEWSAAERRASYLSASRIGPEVQR